MVVQYQSEDPRPSFSLYIHISVYIPQQFSIYLSIHHLMYLFIYLVYFLNQSLGLGPGLTKIRNWTGTSGPGPGPRPGPGPGIAEPEPGIAVNLQTR